MRLQRTLVKAGIAFGVVMCGVALMQSPVVAKGPVDKIAVDGPDTDRIEITAGDALDEFDPWGRQFIDWERGLASEPPKRGEPYTVSFYLDDRVIFVLKYALEPEGGTGYIYIPGPEDPDYKLNAGTIIGGSSDRWDPNGKWQYATASWAAVMPGESRVQPPTTGDGGLR
jgi:hypothetical protein